MASCSFFNQSGKQTKRHFIFLMTALFFVFSAFLVFTPQTYAQQNSDPIPSPVDGTVPGESQGTSSNSDIWRFLKQGGTGSVSTNAPNSAVAIQTNGVDWLTYKNETLPSYTTVGLIGMVTLLSLFFALRGRIRIGHGGASGETILRFKTFERLGHWLLASSFIVLALTGLNLVYGRELLIPLFGKEIYATITNGGKFIHNYVAFAFMAALIWVTITWIKHNVPHPRDLIWFARGGGILGGAHPPAAKFNAGQKVLFWLIILGGLSLSLSGWTLLFPFSTTHFADTFGLLNNIGFSLPTDLTPLQEQQLAQSWHGIVSVILMIVVIAHIYIGSVGMEGAFDAMSSGEVDRNWALEHHSLWVEEEDARSKGNMEAAE